MENRKIWGGGSSTPEIFQTHDQDSSIQRLTEKHPPAIVLFTQNSMIRVLKLVGDMIRVLTLVGDNGSFFSVPPSS